MTESHNDWGSESEIAGVDFPIVCWTPERGYFLGTREDLEELADRPEPPWATGPAVFEGGLPDFDESTASQIKPEYIDLDDEPLDERVIYMVRSSLKFKYATLRGILGQMNNVCVAMSGGADSALLARVAKAELGDKVIAVTVNMMSTTREEIKYAREFCEEYEIPHYVVDVDLLKVEGFVENSERRCYFCKKHVYGVLLDFARDYAQTHGCEAPVVIEGTNLDDLRDYRPGMKALEELGIRSPLLESEFRKRDVCELASEFKLLVPERVSHSCLATRISYGTVLDKDILYAIDTAEAMMREAGFEDVRVRTHGKLVRIEVAPWQLQEADLVHQFFWNGARDAVEAALQAVGFEYITLDVSGYRQGSMNLGL